MSRTGITVKTTYWTLARLFGMEPDSAISTASLPSATVKAKLLNCINQAYTEAYKANEWEDAWQDGSKTVTNGVIAWSDLADAARFAIWSADPRPVGSQAYAVKYVTSNEGVHIQNSIATVYAFWLPPPAVFTDAESTSDTIIPAIADAVVDLARAEYLRSTGQHQTAELYERKGTDKLEKAWCVEFQRVAARTWLRTQT